MGAVKAAPGEWDCLNWHCHQPLCRNRDLLHTDIAWGWHEVKGCNQVVHSGPPKLTFVQEPYLNLNFLAFHWGVLLIQQSLPSTIIATLGACLYDNVVQAGFASWRQSQSLLSWHHGLNPSHCITPWVEWKKTTRKSMYVSAFWRLYAHALQHFCKKMMIWIRKYLFRHSLL